MKILFLSKRSPMGRDLYSRPYGRFYYLPKALADNGHDVYMLLLSYHEENQVDKTINGIHWISTNFSVLKPFSYIYTANKLIKKIKPDWIIGLSDTYYGILAQHLAKKHNLKSMIDAYDNFESYLPWFSWLHSLWRHSLANATLVTAAGPHLAEYLGQYRKNKPTEVLPMAADPIFQNDVTRENARKQLNLPLNDKLIGYCGSISRNRGINLLFDAYRNLYDHFSTHNVSLILSGRLDKDIQIPQHSHWLGYIEDNKIPTLIAALDLLVVINRDSLFGKYSYPVKLYEAMRLNVPVIATRTPATTWILQKHPELLVTPGDLQDLSCSLIKALNLKTVDYGYQVNWDCIGYKLEKLLDKYNKANDK